MSGTQNKLINRYPGIQPFSLEYQNVFYGRTSDIEEIEKMLRIHRMLVVFARSGFGKSSLFNAGLIPKINQGGRHYSFFIRFGSYNQDYPRKLKDIFLEQVQNQLEQDQKVFFSELGMKHWDISMWQWVQTLHWKKKEENVQIVLDQFEELFSYPDEEIEAFIEEFSEIINDRMPEHFRKRLYDRIEEEPEFANRFAEEIESIDQESKTKVVIGIRSDRLSLLDRFSPVLPNILKNNYQLKALSTEQARQAIINPAASDSTTQIFKSPPFTYDLNLLRKILRFLSLGGTKPVETFLLQIICQHVEDWVILNRSEGEEPIVVGPDDIPDLNTIVREYYINVVRGVNLKTKESTFTEHDQLLTRFLIEENLIDRMHNNRISLDMALVKQNGMYDDLIQRLIDVRVIRQEPNTVSGISYELSHDTLIDPILNSEQVLRKLETNINEYYRSFIDVKEQRFVEKYFLSKERKLIRADPSNVYEDDLDTLKHLLHVNIIRDFSLPQEEESKLEVYPMFLGAVLTYRSELDDTKFYKEKRRRRRAVLVSITAITLTIISLVSTIYAISQKNNADHVNSQLSIKKDSLELEKANAITLARVAKQEEEIAKQEKQRSDSLLIVANDYKSQLDIKYNNLQARTNDLENEKEEITEEFTQTQKDLQTQEDSLGKVNQENQKLNAIVEDNSEFIRGIYNQSLSVKDKNPTVALRLAEYCFDAQPKDPTYLKYLYELIGDSGNNFYLSSLEGHTHEIRGLDISKNGNLIVTSSGRFGKEVILWDTYTGRVNKKFKPYHRNAINSVIFTENDSRVITGSSDNFLSVWTLQGNRVPGMNKNMGGQVVSLARHESSKRLFVSVRKNQNSNQDKIYILDERLKPVVTHKNSRLGIGNVIESLNQDIFITGTNSTRAYLWDISKNRPTQVFQGCDFGVRDVRLSPDGSSILASCMKDYGAVLWRTNDKKPYRAFSMTESGTSVEFGLGDEPKTVFIATSNGIIREYNINTKEVIRSFLGHEGRINRIQRSYKSSGVNNFLVSVAQDNTAKIWSLEFSELRKSIIENYAKGAPHSQVKSLIERFLKGNELARLSDNDKLNFHLTGQ